ncbi:MAG: Rrf2 family transcriptional regulator [Clostridiales bacterium]|jgi:Rrf2 family protein|nr:Rrf2 family transcriptional regulator [Clostridiales bacterium]
MRISTKGRYGLAAMLCLAEKSEHRTAVDIAQKLGISKIYLEQVLALLKNAGLVQSLKGSQGGYFIETPPENITVLDIMRATETSVFERTESLNSASPNMEKALQNVVWEPLDKTVQDFFKQIDLKTLLENCKNSGTGYMFYI